MNVTQLTQKAMVAFLQGQALATVVNFYRGIEGADTQASGSETVKRSLPCVVCDAAGAVPGPVIKSGNWWVTAVVHVMTQTDDETETTHAARCAEVFGNFMNTGIEAALSALSGYTAFMVIPEGQNHAELSRMWDSTLTLRIYCCPSDIA
jgi:hypothetical protein